MDRWLNKILCGDCLEIMKGMPDGLVNCVVTSPPYWGLRDYGVEGQLGLEKTPEEYTAKMVEIFREARRVLRDDGVLFLNLGDSYYGSSMTGGTKSKEGSAKRMGHMSEKPSNVQLKPKDLVGIPWRVAFALQADGWYLRQDIIWHKRNAMPESVKDRPTRAHEYIFLMSKSERYYYDHEAIKEPAVSTSLKKFTDNGTDKQRGHVRRHAGFNGRYAETLARDGAPKDRNLRSVWTVATHPLPESHFATFPPELIKPCILAGCPENGIVLDPFFGAGTTGVVCTDLGRNYIGIELNPEYVAMAEQRIARATAQTRMFV